MKHYISCAPGYSVEVTREAMDYYNRQHPLLQSWIKKVLSQRVTLVGVSPALDGDDLRRIAGAANDDPCYAQPGVAQQLEKISNWLGQKEQETLKRYEETLRQLDIIKVQQMQMQSQIKLLIPPGGQVTFMAYPKFTGRVEYVSGCPGIDEVREIVKKLRDDMTKPRLPGTFGVARALDVEDMPRMLRCSDPKCCFCTPSGIAPAPPAPPRLSVEFAQFMQESAERRGYIYRYAKYPASRYLMYDTAVYREMHAYIYDNPEFLNLLAELPERCII